MESKEYMTVEQIASHWGVSKRTVYRRVDDGTLKEPVKVGKRASRWPKKEVMAIKFSRYRSKAPEPKKRTKKKLLTGAIISP